MRAASDFLQTLKPPTPMVRRLGVQSMLFGISESVFITGSAVFFTRIVGLSAAQVGLGLTVGGAVMVAVSIPGGRAVDRFGPREVWLASSVVRFLLFLGWPFIHSFGAFLAMITAVEAVNALGQAGWSSYLLDAVPADVRVRGRAYTYSAINLGFSAGALLSGIALALPGTAAIHWLPWLSAALVVLNLLMLLRLPRIPHGRPVGKQEHRRSTAPAALRNPGFVLTSVLDGVLSTNQVLLNTVIPLWLVVETDAPRWLLAWLFGTNTVLCIFLPPFVARRFNDVRTALVASRISTAFFVVSCAITLLTHSTTGFVTVLLVWLGHVTVTGAELALSPAQWIFQAELSDPDRRGDYTGVQQFGNAAGFVWAPAAYTWLAISWGPQGWVVIAAIAVLAVVLLHPAVRMAQRFLDRHGLDPAAVDVPPVLPGDTALPGQPGHGI